MRIAVVYDCLYPHTVGGAERWLAALVEDLARDHDVTYVTRRQWDRAETDPMPGARVAAVSGGGALYAPGGRRRALPPLLFGLGVLRHFVGHRRDYDVVHCVSFPYFALIAVRAALAGTGTRVIVEWLEHWTDAYWRSYAGRAGGLAGAAVQRLCLALTPAAVVFSRMNEGRLRAAGFDGPVELLPGLYSGSPPPPAPAAAPPRALFMGRHIPEKRVTVVPRAVALAHERLPELRATILGDGPERPRVAATVAELGLGASVEVPGFVSAERLADELAGAACLVAPSVREGHGMVVVEAAAAGVPVVVCRHPDNAAVELVEQGVNGYVADGETPAALAEAIVRAVEGGERLRASTRDWFARHAQERSAAASIRRLRELYATR
ncbi:MAG: glycosyltransferase family 4 protein [Thermoleophilaceae bacterium]